ncbi:MAG TPA: BatA and WFA domain-containing protein [Capsulimonadaceae bacterium]|nr:BatA and WFA domain-containing protein [Capsulimonadaceae bacterium]
MRFVSPLSLLWLLPLLGGIIALYLLRKRRRELVVPSLFLWEKILQSVQADTPFQRLRPMLLLFLQLLTAFLLVLAFARPYLLGSGIAGQVYVLVIDDGARMNATDVSPSRLAEAKDQAINFITHTMSARDAALVISAAKQPALLCPLTVDRSRLAKAIANVAPTDTAPDIPAAMVLAHALLGKRSAGAQAVLFSDGAWTEDEEQRARDAAVVPVRLVQVGASEPANVGIVAMDARRDPDSAATGYQVLVSLRNFSGSAVRAGQLTLFYSGHATAPRSLHMSANGGEQTEIYQSTAFAAGGVVTASLKGLRDDDLASDNTASVVIPAMKARKVLLVTAGDLFLEKGLNLDPDLVLYEVSPKNYASEGHNGVGYDLVVFDDFLPTTLPPGRYLVFHAVNAQMPVQVAGSDVASPNILDWSRTDPAMRFVDLSDLKLRVAAKATAAVWGATLAEADSGPVVVSGENDGSRIIWLAFTPPDSNFGMSISFPIFLTNAVEWLMQDTSAPVGSSRPGEAIPLPHGGDWSISPPDGGNVTLSCGSQQDMACTYTGADRAGLYEASAGQETQIFAVNLSNAALSDLTARSGPDSGDIAAISPRSLRSSESRDIWFWVAIGALALLTLEWLAYHRRL